MNRARFLRTLQTNCIRVWVLTFPFENTHGLIIRDLPSGWVVNAFL